MAKKQKKSKLKFELENQDLIEDGEVSESVAGAVAGAASAFAAFAEEQGELTESAPSQAVDMQEQASASLGAREEEATEIEAASAVEGGDETAVSEIEAAATEHFDEEVAEEAMKDAEGTAEVALEDEDPIADTEGTELEAYASAEIEDIEELTEERLTSIVESLLFTSDKPQSVAVLKGAFAGTKVRAADIRRALERLQIEYSHPARGVELLEVAGGYQLRTKQENSTYLQRTVKARPFKLSGPALEVLSIVAYKQPTTKAAVDEIRGVESGHLMRGLLERGLIAFAGKSDLPGRPMLYETTKKFLETFGLRSLQELPTLNEIDQLIPEGIDETEEKKQTLGDLTEELAEKVGEGVSYSQGEADLQSISEELQSINLTTAFFEEEKRRQKEKRDAERAQDIRERLLIGEEVSERDKRWLARYELSLANPAPAEGTSEAVVTASEDVETIESFEAAQGADVGETVEATERPEVGDAAEAAAGAETGEHVAMNDAFEVDGSEKLEAVPTEGAEAVEESVTTEVAFAEVAPAEPAPADDVDFEEPPKDAEV